MRVPVPAGSAIDLTFEAGRETTAEEVNAAMKAAADSSMKGYFLYTEGPIVSSDIVTDPHSCISDAGLTKVLGNQLIVGNLATAAPADTTPPGQPVVGHSGCLPQWSAGSVDAPGATAA